MQTEQALPLATAPPAPVRTVRRIEASRGLVPIDFGEFWRFRELLGYLIWRDVKARYKQTFLGSFWAIFRPFIQMVLFTIVFGRLAGIKSGNGTPYPLFVFTGLLAWTYFSSALTGGASSLVSNGSMIAKAYFPRLYAPLASVTAPLVDFGLAFLVLLGLFVYYWRLPSWHIVFLPGFLLLCMFVGMGIGLWLSGIAVRYRDTAFALPFVIQLWMYATPVLYPVSLVPGKWQWLLALNPMTAVVDGFRWSLFGVPVPSGTALVGSACVSLAILVPGLFFFRRTERTIVDIL